MQGSGDTGDAKFEGKHVSTAEHARVIKHLMLSHYS